MEAVVTGLAELRHALDALEDAADAIRKAISEIVGGLPAGEVVYELEEINLYGPQGVVLYRAVRQRSLEFRVDWPRGISGSHVVALSVVPL